MNIFLHIPTKNAAFPSVLSPISPSLLLLQATINPSVATQSILLFFFNILIRDSPQLGCVCHLPCVQRLFPSQVQVPLTIERCPLIHFSRQSPLETCNCFSRQHHVRSSPKTSQIECDPHVSSSMETAIETNGPLLRVVTPTAALLPTFSRFGRRRSSAK